MSDKTNFAQSLMHMIKGNLGTGILAMPASFAHAGLINALYGLPLLCLVATYCVHLLVKSSQRLEGRTKGLDIQYASLAKHSFKSGPDWMKSCSPYMCPIVDGILLVAQLGVCSVYVVFVADNLASILASYDIHLTKTTVFLAIYPVALLLSYIKTLNRLAIASAFANILQAVGISIIMEYLLRDLDQVDMSRRDNFRPLSEVALSFGSAMFAFEGISVVLPVYTRMRNQNRMLGSLGIINLSFVILLILYFIMGLFGFLKFGHDARGSITLNLPPEPLYDCVRAMFTLSILLTYPLQFYVPNEIIWEWAKKNLLSQPIQAEVTALKAIEVVIPPLKVLDAGKESTSTGVVAAPGGSKLPKTDQNKNSSPVEALEDPRLERYDYYCRTIVVTATFLMAVSVPRLNLLMDLIGSITGTSLSLMIPALIHIATFWDDSKGFKKLTLVLVDSSIIIVGFLAGLSGSVFSIDLIIKSFRQ